MNFVLRNLFRKSDTVVRTFSIDVNIKSQAEKWDLFAGVSLERLPIISRDYNEFETTYSKILTQIELQNSHKSNFEIRLENDLKRAKELKEGKIENAEMDNIPQQTAQDFYDACQEEYKSFAFEARNEDEKSKQNVKSTKRELDRRLLLLIHQKIGEKYFWTLPQGLYMGETSLKLTAERVLREKCGDNLQVRFLGACPCGFYQYKYPKHARNTSVGAKIFFFKTQLVKGHIDEKLCQNYQWATRKELNILPKDYCKTVRKFLIDEEH